ncbi:MAG TPA: hypothetical protein VMT35_14515 [Ignavibacteriaceae bacterium]|nr:hypothetical protein [Ignavibacteriaceae bacterium]
MNFTSNKYRKSSAALFLSAQIFLISLTTFHFHNIDIKAGNFSFKGFQELPAAIPIDSPDDTAYNCSVQQFSTSIYNLSFSDYYICLFQNNTYFDLSYISEKPQQEYFNSNYLRAPPFSS